MAWRGDFEEAQPPNEYSETDSDGTSTIVSDNDIMTNIDQGEPRPSREMCVLLECTLDLERATHGIATQLQYTKDGERYKVSAAAGIRLFTNRDYPYRLLFVNSEDVEGADRRAMTIRHDFTA